MAKLASPLRRLRMRIHRPRFLRSRRNNHDTDDNESGSDVVLASPPLLAVAVIKLSSPFVNLARRFRRRNNGSDDGASTNYSYTTTSSLRAWRLHRRIGNGLRIVIFPWGLYVWAHHKVIYSDWYDRRQERAQMRRPRPKKRRRDLSPPVREEWVLESRVTRRSVNLGVRKRTTAPQPKSGLLALPPELRLMIWEEYLGIGEETYVLLREGRLGSFRVGEGMEKVSYPRRRNSWDSLVTEDGEIPKIVYDRVKRRKVDVLPLLMSCRAVYAEVIPLLYRRTNFTFCDIYTFLLFTSSLLPTRLASIQHLDFTFGNLYHSPPLIIPPSPAPYHIPTTSSKVVPSFELTPETLFLHPDTYYFNGDNIRNSLDYALLRKYSKTPVFNKLPKRKPEDKATTWDAAVEMLGRMEGLKKFSMVVDRNRFYSRRTTVEKGLLMLSDVQKRVESFDVEVRWHILPPPPPPPPPHLIIPGPPPPPPPGGWLPPPPPPPFFPFPPIDTIPSESARGRLVDGKLKWEAIRDGKELKVVEYEDDDDDSWI